jgi:hypothetical protein
MKGLNVRKKQKPETESSNHKGQKPRKPFWKRWWVWAIALVVISPFFADPEDNATSEGDETQNSISSQTETPASVSISDTGSESAIDSNEVDTVTESEAVSTESEEASSSVDAQTETAFSDLSEYEIIAVEDISFSINRRLVYRVVISSQVTQEQVEPTLRKIINDAITQDDEVDEVTVFMYSSADVANGAFDIGRAAWSYEGQESDVPERVARTNDRARHRITYDVKPDVEAYIVQRNRQEERFGLTEEQRRNFYLEVREVRNRATQEADETYPPIEDYNRNQEYFKQIEEAYISELLSNYGIDTAIHREINTEALQENWPLSN